MYSRSPLRLGELRQWNAYEIVRIPRADNGSTLGRPRAYIATALTAIPRGRGGEGDPPVCLIKSICASTKRDVRAIVLARRNLESAYICKPSSRSRAENQRASLSLRPPPCFRAIIYRWTHARPGTASLYPTGIIAEPQGHFFQPSTQLRCARTRA